jgi:hypothetical protein
MMNGLNQQRNLNRARVIRAILPKPLLSARILAAFWNHSGVNAAGLLLLLYALWPETLPEPE